MPVQLDNLVPLSSMANSDAGKTWSYKTVDAPATVVASGYFDTAVDYGIAVGDIIWTLGTSGGVETFNAVMIDAISAAGVVTTLSSSLTLA